MYPKNAASPERIAVGAVIQISDGAVQTSGCTITVRGQGGAEATGGGTTAYGATGIVYYTPTQAETNYTSFVVIASKSGCYPVPVTVVTTAESTAGTVKLGATQTADITGDITGNLSGSVGSVTGAVGSVTGSVGSVTGSVGSISGVTFPSNFGDLAITVTTGRVTVGTNADKTGYDLNADQSAVTVGTVTTNTDMRGTDDALLASSAPTNWGSMVISGSGAVDSLVQGFINNTISETTPGRIAANFVTFTENGDAVTTKTLDDVGTATVSGTVDANVIEIKGTALGETSSGYLAGAFEYFFDVASPAKTINDCGVAGSGLSAEDVWTYGTRVLTAGTNLNDPTAAAIADAVWDEATSGHTTAGTFGKASIDTLADTNELQTDWTNGGRLDLIIDAILVDTDATESAVANLPADTSSEITNSADWTSMISRLTTIDTVVDSILVDTGTTIPAQISGLNDIAATDIVSGGAITTSGGAVSTVTTCTTNTDMRGTDSAATAVNLATVDTNVDTLITQLTTDVAEAGVPGATATVPEMIATMYGATRNKITVTASAKTFHDDAGTAVWSKALSDDGTTYTEAEGA